MKTRDHQTNLASQLRNHTQKQLPKGHALYFSDDTTTIAIIDSGYVKRYLITNDGSQSIQAIYGPGDIFPLTPIFRILFDQALYTGQETLYYETMTPVTLHAMSKEAFKEIVASDPSLYKDLMSVCGVRLRSNIQRLENMALKSALKQVAHQLVFMAEQFGTPNPDGTITIEVPLTHQTIANSLSLARETVTQAINRLVERELIQTDPSLRVIDMHGLRNLSA